MQEYELKIVLSKEEYSKIVEKYSNDSNCTVQTNYYFDNPDFTMNENGITYRTRNVHGKFITTIKNHSNKIENCSDENTILIDDRLNADVFSEIGLSLQGCLVTERMDIYNDRYCKIVLDRNIYLGQIDYELECEYIKGFDNYALRLIYLIADMLLEQHLLLDVTEFVRRSKNFKTKSERFFECLARNA